MNVYSKQLTQFLCQLAEIGRPVVDPQDLVPMS